MLPLEAFTEAFAQVMQPSTLAFMLLGTALGLLVGFLPGLGGVVGLSLVVPFLFGLDPYHGIALLIGTMAVTTTSDTFSSILLGIPGTVAAQATILDGYPMAKRGEALRALSAAFTSSMVGGIIGALALLLVMGSIRPVILALGSPELFMMSIFGLATVAILAKGQPLAGVMSALLGMGLGLVGMAPVDGVMRYTGGSLYLYDGLAVSVVALGLFAVPEFLGLLTSGESVASSFSIKGGRLQGIKDAFTHRWLLVRTSLVGVGVGVTPGLGASVVDWIAYGFGKQTSKNSETFGTGDIRGVISVEGAANSKDGGALIPTLLFGIPGGAGMAVLLVALPMLGLRPGPAMLNEGLSVTIVVVITLVLANIVATSFCIGVAPYVARITVIRPTRLVPVLFPILVVGAYQASQHVGDLVTFMLIGCIGWVFKRHSWPRPPLMIGFALSLGAERYLGRSVAHYGWSWLTNPIVIVIGLITLAIVVAGARGRGVDTEAA